MTRFGWTVVLSVLTLLALVGGTVFYIRGNVPTETPQTVSEPIATSTDPTALELYSNGDYGFSLAYPKGTLATTSTNLVSTSTKKASEVTPVSIALTDASLFVRVSNAVSACSKARPSETMVSTTTFGGAEWRVFSRDELGTDTELHDTSYRTVHEGMCVTIFAQQPYREGIHAVREDLAQIIESFSFARP